MNTKHTPTPWKWIEGSDGEFSIEAENDAKTLAMSIEKETDAAFIVLACNAHEELVELAKMVKETLGLIPAFGDDLGEQISKAELGVLVNLAKKAIAKAKGK